MKFDYLFFELLFMSFFSVILSFPEGIRKDHLSYTLDKFFPYQKMADSWWYQSEYVNISDRRII